MREIATSISGSSNQAHRPAMREVTTLTDLKEIVDSGVLLIVWFSATWCGPCKSLDRQALTEIARDLNIELVHCDVDKGKSVATACGIRSVPTFMAFIDGEPDLTLSTADFMAIRRFFHKVASQVVQ